MPVTPIGTNIGGIGSTGALGRVGQTPAPTAAAGFTEALEKLVTNIETTNTDANTAVNNMLNGTGEVHTAMIALHEAEEAFEVSVTLRNKFVQAYQEIMRMPI